MSIVKSNPSDSTSNSSIFVIIIIIGLIAIYIFYETNFCKNYKDTFQIFQPVDYSTRKQNCDELTFSPSKCSVDTVVPKRKLVCDSNLVPMRNIDIGMEMVTDKDMRIHMDTDTSKENEHRKKMTLEIDSDLVVGNEYESSSLPVIKPRSPPPPTPGYGQGQGQNPEQTTPMLDVKSLASLENDLMSNQTMY